MNKRVMVLLIIVFMIVICFSINYSYSKYSFNESFVAFRINEETITNTEVNTQSTNKESDNNQSGMPNETVKEEKMINTMESGWIDIVKIEH